MAAKTEFGELLEEYRTRAGISQEEVSTRMMELGYRGRLGQRMYSHLLYKPQLRVYPEFFDLISQVLGLSFTETHQLLTAWIGQAR